MLTPFHWIMGNCRVHCIRQYAGNLAGASEAEEKNGAGKIFWRVVFFADCYFTPWLVTFVWISSLHSLLICINC